MESYALMALPSRQKLPPRSKVFLAYHSGDFRVLSTFRGALRKKNRHQVITAEYDPGRSAEWRSKVEAELGECDFFVPLLSKNFLDSPESRRELSGVLDLADQSRARIIPLLIEDLAVETLPLTIRSIPYVRHQPFDGLINQLLQELGRRDLPGHLANRAALEAHIRQHDLSSGELITLAEEIGNAPWPNVKDKSYATKLIADRLKNRRRLGEAARLYDIIIERYYPQQPSLRVARAEINAFLGNFDQANADCLAILANEPTNIYALHRQFWVNQAWLISKPSRAEAGDQIETIRRILLKMMKLPGTWLPHFLCVSIRVMAEGAMVAQERLFGDYAFRMIANQHHRIMKANKLENRRSLLKALRTLRLFYQSVGDASMLEKVEGKLSQFENEWRMHEL